MIHAPNMLLIGAAGRDAGKTTFACEMIRHFHGMSLLAAKVTAIQEKDGRCPRGGEGCGVCSSLKGDYCITEETDPDGDKDTQRLMAAGATRVLWLRVLKQKLKVGAQALMAALGTVSPILCESNSLRLVVEPGLFLMLQNQNSPKIKHSAQAVLPYANKIIMTDGEIFHFNIENIIVKNNMWQLSNQTTRPHLFPNP